MNSSMELSQINSVIDGRVSTDKQLYGFSLDDQEEICKRYAETRNWNVLKIYLKAFSGRKEEREDFENILKDVQQMQLKGIEVRYYVIKSIDRFTRLGSEVFSEMKRRLKVIGVELVDAHGVIQPEINRLEYLGHSYPWSVQSSTEIAQVIEAERARQEVSDILTRMIGAEIQLTKRGYKARGANDGFVNKDIFVDGKQVKIQVRDPERAQFYEKMFELRARGDLPDEEIVERINAMGYLSKEKAKWKREGKKKIRVGTIKGKKLTIKRLQKVIQRPTYVGIMCEKWTHNKPIWSRSESLIDIDTFNKANRGKVFVKIKEDGNPELLYNHTNTEKTIKRRNKYNSLFLYDKMVMCPECKKPFLSSSSRSKTGKRHPAYHCSRNHPRVSGNKREFERNVSSFLSQIHLSKGFMKYFEVILMDKYCKREAEIVLDASKMNENVGDLKAQQAELLKTFTQTNSDIVRSKIEQQIEELETNINKATQKRNEIEIQERDIKSFVQYAKDLMELPVKSLINNSNSQIQKRLFSLVFETPPTYAEILNGTPKLTLFFKLSEQFKVSKDMLVTLQGVEWNSLAKMIKEWNDTFNDIQKIKEYQQNNSISSEILPS